MAAATSALDLISTLTKPLTAKTSGGSNFSVGAQTGASASVGTATGQGNRISPDTMNALFAAQSQGDTPATGRSQALKSLFSQLDGDGDGAISKSEFESALGAGGTNIANAGKVFGKLDSDGDGSVSMAELGAALKPKKHAHGPKENGQDALLQALDGANATTTANGDGSTTSTVTYADGSTVTMTKPATASASSSAARSYNVVEQMLQQQIDQLSKPAGTASTLSVSV
jgi:hypothetical protein